MKLKTLENGRHRVATIIDDKGRSEVLDFLSNVSANYQGSAKGFRALFRRYAQGGRQELTMALFHEANKEAGIWEFVKGQLRVFCFMDGPQLVILSHGGLKKGQKASKQDVEQAARLKDQYLQAKATGNLQESPDERE